MRGIAHLVRAVRPLGNAARPAILCLPVLTAGRAASVAPSRIWAGRVDLRQAMCAGFGDQQKRMMSGKGKAEEPQETLETNLAEMRDFLRREIENEAEEHIDATIGTDGPPAGFKLVPTGKYLSGNDDVVVMLERKYNNERIIVVTSTEDTEGMPLGMQRVVETPDDDISPDEMDEEHEQEEDEDEPNGMDEEGGGVHAMLLVAITKPEHPQPLYFECFFDRYGVEILKSHVGLGFSGFMSEQGTAATLYHTFLAYNNETKGEAGSIAEYMEDDQAATSPAFEQLDDKLQKHFNQLLAERGVNAQLCEHLMDLIFNKEHLQYQKFLKRLEEWVAN